MSLSKAHTVDKQLLLQCGVHRDAQAGIRGASKASDAGTAKDNDDDDDFDDEYSAEDLVMVPAITSLVGMAQQLLVPLYGYVLKTAPSAPAAGAVMQLLAANNDASAAAASSSASASAASSSASSLSSMVESPERVAWLEAVLAQARSLVVGVDETVAAVGDEEGVTLAAVQKLTQQCRLLAASVVRHHRATPGAKWSMSAPGASATAPAEEEAAPAWSHCVACQSICERHRGAAASQC
jgi:hypothetical protein